jgi:hypothetical protein
MNCPHCKNDRDILLQVHLEDPLAPKRMCIDCIYAIHQGELPPYQGPPIFPDLQKHSSPMSINPAPHG